MPILRIKKKLEKRYTERDFLRRDRKMYRKSIMEGHRKVISRKPMDELLKYLDLYSFGRF